MSCASEICRKTPMLKIDANRFISKIAIHRKTPMLKTDANRFISKAQIMTAGRIYSDLTVMCLQTRLSDLIFKKSPIESILRFVNRNSKKSVFSS
jgi:hypothetical protein